MKSFYTVFFIFISTLASMAQNGTLRGAVRDGDTGETVPFANILIDGTDIGFTTDLDGAYSHDLPAGAYTLKVSYVGYADYRIENVEVKAGRVTLVDIAIQEDAKALKEVLVEARQLKDTESAILRAQQRSVNLINGISSQAFRRTGDSNAGSAIKRVTGVSVNDGKYVFVRGLGDRYSKTLLNGMDVPGLDPDRNSLQLDIFPTQILDNIIVSKTATANLPGDFTGGLIDIATKEFPEEKQLNVSLGFGFNPSMHLRSDFLYGERSPTDWLGVDSGLRDLNVKKKQHFPSPIDDPQLTRLTSRFRNNMGVRRTTGAPNYNFGVSLGNQVKKGSVTLGYNAALGYRSVTRFYEDVQFGIYQKPRERDLTTLRVDKNAQGDLGEENAMLSALVGGALKFHRHKVSLTALRLQNGTSRAGLFTQDTYISGSNRLVRHNVEYTERSITNLLLKGSHQFSNTFRATWAFSPTYSSIHDKDVRVTPFRESQSGNFTIEPSEGAEPRRLWRDLDETSYAARADAVKSFSALGRDIDVKAGIANTYKARDYGISQYLVRVIGQNELGIDGDPDKLFLQENIWTPETDRGIYMVGNFEPANTYSATQNIFAAYLMADVNVTDRFKVNAGVRMEKFTQRYTGENNDGSVVYKDKEILDDTDFLPSVNLLYRLGNSMNLRASYARTLARPSFKEASIAQIYDPISGWFFLGNVDIKTTRINNFDLRWEWFGSEGQTVSVSGFYKTFTDPIEMVTYSAQTSGNFQPRNVGDANVGGVEVEFRKHLGFISPSVKSFYVGANVTLLRSEVQMDRSPDGEYESRTTNLRVGETIGETRVMQGQAPYVVNAYINYMSESRDWEANLSYNVQGETLSVVGLGVDPDVYTIPYNDMSFRVSRRFGPTRAIRLSVGVSNLLDAEKTRHYVSYGAESRIFDRYRPRRTYSVSLNWRIR